MSSRRANKSSSIKRDAYSRASRSRNSSRGRTGRDYSRSQISHVATASERKAGGYSRSVSRDNYSNIRKKKRKRKRILVTVVVVALALVLGGGAAALGWMGMVNSQLQGGLGDLDDVLVAKQSTEPYYMLLMGTDGREADEPDRTDTIILARIDAKNKQVVLISIPRDTRVQIEGHGYQKINAAHAYGGAKGAVEAVSNLAGVEISHYAEIDFSGFKGLVDTLGGVEVDVPFAIDDWDAGGEVDAGLQVLDGEHALIFCRSRNTSIGDYQRQANQRMFLQALASKVLQADPATMLAAVNSIAGAVSTDMNVQTIVGLANELSGLSTDNIYTYTVPSSPQTIDGVSYVVADTTEWQKMMATIDAGSLPDEQSESLSGIVADEYKNGTSSGSSSSTSSVDVSRSSYPITVRNGGGIEGSASSAASKLQEAGYQINDTGNTNQFVYDTTLVVYNDDADKQVASDIINVLGMGQAVASNGRYSFDGKLMVVVGSDWK